MGETAYRWAHNRAYGVPVQALGETMQTIRREKGAPVTADDLVRAAEPPDSPLHTNYWDWDNEIAGPKWREVQARQLIRAVRIEAGSGEGEVAETPAFVHVSVVRDGEAVEGYEETSVAMRRLDTRQWVVQETLGQLEGLRRRYACLTELGGVWEEVDKAAAVIKPKEPEGGPERKPRVRRAKLAA